ncbi:MAG: homoserine O-acetyltransferase/O-succinyltransferase [Clostridiales bacterium]|nr:homoserine O-acetyltransferase/O-succinyltransferase [Clostridiales bacterium]
MYRQEYTFAYPPDLFVLESGQKLGPITVVYETYGALNADKSNIILVEHALTGDSHIARHSEHDSRKGWWEQMLGPGLPLDPEKYFIICANVLGGCQGTTGPSSIDPATGRPYGMRFPTITIRDMVRVQKKLLEHMGIEHVMAVIGGSMGGMQALEWAVLYPDFIDGIFPIATPGKLYPQAIGFNYIMRRTIMLDPKWNNGDYYETGEQPALGLGIARMLGMMTYQSDESMRRKFGRMIGRGRERFGIKHLKDPTIKFDVETYLDYQGEKLVRRFDANSYIYLSRAMDLFDLSMGYKSMEEALSRIICKVKIMGISSDILFPKHQQLELIKKMRGLGIDATYVELTSIYGHDSFLIEYEKLKPIIQRFLLGLRNSKKKKLFSFM